MQPKWKLGLIFMVIACFGVCSAGSGCAGAAPGTIGAQLGQSGEGRLFVRSIPPGQGADRAGLEIDDEILAIDGKPVAQLTQEEVRRAVRGDVGSQMTLRIERGGLRREVKVQRTPLLAGEGEKK